VHLLETVTPVAVEESAWAKGTLPLRICAFTTPAELPDELVLSVRCLVIVEGQLVVCENADGYFHAWPGGRREPGETFVETACREVHEETGWRLNPDTLRPMGWLHLQHLNRQPDDHPYPHPDFLQIVYSGKAASRDGGQMASWTDTEGYELRSQLLPLDAACDIVNDSVCNVFLRELAGRL
jgi:ADP-ribose pyrophosphatase YjhB (NUDIX family)